MSKQSSFDSIIKQYETNSVSYNKSNSSKEYDLKNYFTTHIPDKQLQATKRIRILPTEDGSTPFKEIWGHKAQVGGEWKTYACLKHEKGTDCPFCEAREALLSMDNEASKDLAKQYSARKMYVVKVIDRDNEDHGVKFWRFNHDYNKKGAFDLIFGLLKAINKDITDVETGRDLIILVSRDANNRPRISTINSADPSPLSESKDLAKKWLSDTRTWEDVYSVRDYDYLRIVVEGGVPVWSKEAKKYVNKEKVNSDSDDMEDEILLAPPSKKSSQTVAKSTKKPVVTKKPVKQEEEEEDDDLKLGETFDDEDVTVDDDDMPF